MKQRWLQLKFICEYAKHLHLYDVPPLELIFKFINELDKKDVKKIFSKFNKTQTATKVFKANTAVLDKLKTDTFVPGTLGFEFQSWLKNSEGAVDLFKFGYEGKDTTKVGKFFKQAVMQHDLIHFLNGYDTNPMSEVGVLSFNLAKEWRESYATILYSSFLMSIRNTFMPSKYPSNMPWYKAIKYSAAFVFCRVVIEGWRRGKRAPWFMDVDWDKYLNVNLQQVKKDLKLEQPLKYWPHVQPIWETLLYKHKDNGITVNRT